MIPLDIYIKWFNIFKDLNFPLNDAFLESNIINIDNNTYKFNYYFKKYNYLINLDLIINNNVFINNFLKINNKSDLFYIINNKIETNVKKWIDYIVFQDIRIVIQFRLKDYNYTEIRREKIKILNNKNIFINKF